MTRARRQVGVSGEGLAAAYLRRKGYRIIERNFRCKLGEIDLIAEDQGTIVICEVKTKVDPGFSQPFESVYSAKRERLRRLGEYYWSFKTDRKAPCRFDVISITLQTHPQIEHVENAF